MAIKAKIKSVSLDTITRIIEVLSSIISQLDTWYDLWRNRWLKKKQKKLYKEAEKALKDKDIEKINDIIHRRH